MLLAQLSPAPSIWIAARWVNDVIEQVMLETEQEQTKEKERERQQARINERLASYDDRLHTWLFGSRCKLDNCLLFDHITSTSRSARCGCCYRPLGMVTFEGCPAY